MLVDDVCEGTGIGVIVASAIGGFTRDGCGVAQERCDGAECALTDELNVRVLMDARVEA